MIPIIVIVGPTAVGKTTLSLALAKEFSAEIISADAMQFYRGLDIGTAKIMKSEQQGIPHHLIDFLNPDAEFSVADYQRAVRETITTLQNQKKPIIIVGGSGLYLQSALFDYDFSGAKRTDETIKKYEDFSNEELHVILKNLNRDLAESVHPNNRRRLLRSLEIAESKEVGFFEKGKSPIYENMIFIGLRLPREQMYDSINKRVDDMFQKGLVEEVKGFYEQGLHTNSLLAIGYKELYLYFDGLCTLEEAKETIKLHSRRYAKRQLTWFRNKMEIEWFDSSLENFDKTINGVIHFIKK